MSEIDPETAKKLLTIIRAIRSPDIKDVGAEVVREFELLVKRYETAAEISETSSKQIAIDVQNLSDLIGLHRTALATWAEENDTLVDLKHLYTAVNIRDQQLETAQNCAKHFLEKVLKPKGDRLTFEFAPGDFEPYLFMDLLSFLGLISGRNQSIKYSFEQKPNDVIVIEVFLSDPFGEMGQKVEQFFAKRTTAKKNS